MSVMAETHQSAMGPYFAMAVVGLALNAWTAVFREALVVKVFVKVQAGGESDGGGGVGGEGGGGKGNAGGGSEGDGGGGLGDCGMQVSQVKAHTFLMSGRLQNPWKCVQKAFSS